MNTAFLCHSKDCNREVTLEFIDAAFKHLPLNKYPMFITSEYEPFGVCHSILTGDGVWSARLRTALKQVPDHIEHIIFFLEDMIVKNCNEGILDEIIQYHANTERDHDCTKLGTHPFFTLEDTGDTVAGYKVLRQRAMPYILSHQPVSIWKRKFLEDVIQDDVTPWDHECITGQKLCDGAYGYHRVFCVGQFPAIQMPVGYDYGEIIEYHHLLTRGQRIPYIGKYQ